MDDVRWTVRIPRGLGEDIDDLCRELKMTRSQLMRDLLEEAVPSLAPVLVMVRQAREEGRTDAKWFIESYKAVMLNRVRQLELSLEGLEEAVNATT